MLVTQHPIFRRFWYPVMPLSLLEAGSPQPFELLGEKIVLWLDEAGQPQAAADRCCHRSAQLSKGIVCEGHIRCPYHGWEFDGTGACVKVPQLQDPSRIPDSYRIPAYPCQVRYGYAWVCLDPQPLRGIPVIPEAEDPRYRLIHEFYERWECAGLRICENEFDHPDQRPRLPSSTVLFAQRYRSRYPSSRSDPLRPGRHLRRQSYFGNDGS